MKKIQMMLLFTVIFLIILAGPVCWNSVSAQTCPQWIAKVVSVQGSVEIKKAGGTEWKATQLKEALCPGDMIRVMKEGRAALVLITGVIVRLDQYSTVVFNGVEREASLVEILKGVANFFSRWPRSLKVYTPFVNGTVEGTEFLVKVGDDKTLISIFEGRVEASNKAGSLMLTSGQSAIAEAGKAPVPYVVVNPRDAVQWALYYPSVTYHCQGEFKENDPRFYTCRASSLLHVGRLDEAKADIGKALSLDPNNSEAFALQAIIAVVQNEQEKALSLAKKAVEAVPRSAAALVSLSYAQQAKFDLKGALNRLNEAVKAEPENALAWARLAEIHLSFGELDEALKAANNAVELNPNIARTQIVMGFAYLTQVKIKESMSAFEKAIELDQADPLPRLGLGLAKIRTGCLEEGRKEIEIAVSLDPDNSLIRSYLGKAYYEEKKDKMANDQYGMAKEFDPKDPTPFFYEAIKKQTENRPVEALEEMQKAIELNDNRAVYRSKLLLDADLAARSASLARIYTDLGFQDRALVEGWKSVNTDPADFSGHRFLSDSYSALPRHEIARVSELLQSQLLQPININPVQPHLAESNLFILEGAGPADLSFNEFNPLFNRNRFTLQLSGIAGGQDTFGDEIVVSTVQGAVSLSAGQFHFETDGFRNNNDQKQDIYDLFAQVALSPQTSVQAEFRAKNWQRGDLSLNFFPDDFLPRLRLDDETRSIRFGVRHSISPCSDILGSFIYQNAEFDLHDASVPVVIFDKKSDADSYGGEIQHLYRSQYINLIGGVGYFNINETHDVSLEFLFPPPPTTSSSRLKTDVKHTNFYLYSQIHYPKNIILTIGGSADFFEGGIKDRDQFSPKFGLTWNLLPETTIRAAAFRVLKRNLITDQTLEPTQVAGFNQFYDDLDATDSWRYGVAVDQKFSKNVYGGMEFSWRDLEAPFLMVSSADVPEVRQESWKERMGRAYLLWTPNKMLSLSAEGQYEKLDEKLLVTSGIDNVRTYRFPVGINFFHPSGFSAMLKATYTDQKGRFRPQLSDTIQSGSDQFWLIDATISYRLPKRLGIIKVGVKNLFDRSFKYQDTDPSSPVLQPKRLVFARLTVSL